MKTTQAVVARLEGGGSMPSTRTLEKYAKATGTRLKSALSRKGREPSPVHAASVFYASTCFSATIPRWISGLLTSPRRIWIIRHGREQNAEVCETSDALEGKLFPASSVARFGAIGFPKSVWISFYEVVAESEQ